MKKLSASFWAAHIAIWVTVALTIAAEFSAELKNSLAGITGHHWVTKSVLAVLIFFLISSARGSKKSSAESISRGAMCLFVSAATATVVFIAFFVWHFYLA